MDTLQTFLRENELQADVILHLLNQGIEVERLKLEIHRCTNAESIESHIKIIHGERFSSLLIAAAVG